MREEHLYLIAYDITVPKRWQGVFRAVGGSGVWLQLSISQCRLSVQCHPELIALLDGIIHHSDGHVMLIDVGFAG